VNPVDHICRIFQRKLCLSGLRRCPQTKQKLSFGGTKATDKDGAHRWFGRINEVDRALEDWAS
jgi:hypothetical protein